MTAKVGMGINRLIIPLAGNIRACSEGCFPNHSLTCCEPTFPLVVNQLPLSPHLLRPVNMAEHVTTI